MVFTYNSDLLLIGDYKELIQSLKGFSIPKEIPQRSLNLDFRQKIHKVVNSCISAKMRLVMEDISCQFSLDMSKNLESQIHDICLWAIESSNTFIAVIGIIKAMQFHGTVLSHKIQEYLLSFLLDSKLGNKEQTGNFYF